MKVFFIIGYVWASPCTDNPLPKIIPLIQLEQYCRSRNCSYHNSIEILNIVQSYLAAVVPTTIIATATKAIFYLCLFRFQIIKVSLISSERHIENVWLTCNYHKNMQVSSMSSYIILCFIISHTTTTYIVYKVLRIIVSHTTYHLLNTSFSASLLCSLHSAAPCITSFHDCCLLLFPHHSLQPPSSWRCYSLELLAHELITSS